MDLEIYKFIISFFWAFVISIFAIPSIINLAHKRRIYDIPNSRTIHRDDIPRLGGIAIFAGFFSSALIFSNIQKDVGIQYLLGGMVLLFFVGLKDDVWPVSAFKKFFVQLFCCSIVIFLGNVRVTSFHGLFGVFELEPGLSYLFTFLVVIGLTNAINLIDGVNGLAGSIVVVITVFLTVLLSLVNSPYTSLGFSLSGAMIGFLRYNIIKGRIFMGDTGSLISGFAVSVLAVHLLQTSGSGFSPILVMSIFVIPTVDTIRVMILRLISGISPFSPDQRHIHHVLVRLGLKHIQIVLIAVTFNVVVVATVWLLSTISLNVQIAGLSFWVVVLLLFIWRLDNHEIKN